MLRSVGRHTLALLEPLRTGGPRPAGPAVLLAGAALAATCVSGGAGGQGDLPLLLGPGGGQQCCAHG